MTISTAPFKVREGDEVDLGRWLTKGKPLCKSKKAYRKLLKDLFFSAPDAGGSCPGCRPESVRRQPL